MPETARRFALETSYNDIESVKRACAAFRDLFAELRNQIGRVIVGQDEVVEQTLIALLGNGHILLEGVPGLGKTLLVRTLAQTLTLTHNRIQFTADLMPADITGTSIVVEDPQTGRRSFEFRPGPIFHQLVLADEINRATPKSQAALLEAMQEKSVTVAGRTHTLVEPFFVMATQNPIEQEGTYTLPEAQLDRFFFKIVVPYATRNEMWEVLSRTTAGVEQTVEPIVDGSTIQHAQKLARRIIVAPPIQDYIIRLVLATHPGSQFACPDLDRYIHCGVSPRGAQTLITGAKVKALIDGRYAIGFRDVHDIARAALRHRIVRTFEAESENVSADDIVTRLIDYVPREYDEPQRDRAGVARSSGRAGASSALP